MIRITFRRGLQHWDGFRSSGHSGYAAAGSDIVCAGVSAVVQTALQAVLAISEEAPVYEIADGLLECSIPRAASDLAELQIQSILDAAFLGCVSLAQQYPRYIQLHVDGLAGWEQAAKEPDALRHLIQLIKRA